MSYNPFVILAIHNFCYFNLAVSLLHCNHHADFDICHDLHGLIIEEHVPHLLRDENGTDAAGYRVISYPTLMYFSRIRDRIWVVKIRDGYRTGPGNNLDG
jgi:ATP-dependent exoDNAse (exonuclease V) beta subunit